MTVENAKKSSDLLKEKGYESKDKINETSKLKFLGKGERKAQWVSTHSAKNIF